MNAAFSRMIVTVGLTIHTLAVVTTPTLLASVKDMIEIAGIRQNPRLVMCLSQHVAHKHTMETVLGGHGI